MQQRGKPLLTAPADSPSASCATGTHHCHRVKHFLYAFATLYAPHLPFGANHFQKKHTSAAQCDTCRQEPAAAGTKRPRPQESDPVPDSTLHGAAQSAEASADLPAVAMAADAAAVSDSADHAAVAAAVAVTQRADAILHNVSSP